MADQTAREAVAGAIFKATFTAEWDDCPDGYQETRAMILRDADAILEALGIPPDTPVDTIRAGLLRMLNPSMNLLLRRDGSWEAWMPTYDGWGSGVSPTVAVLALAERIPETRRA